MMEEAPPTALIVGCGYLGTRVAVKLLERGWAVTATTRTPGRLAELRSLGARAELLDLSSCETSRAVDSVYRAVVYAVSPGRGDGRLGCLEGPLRILAALHRPPDRFVYVSSTGVYTQRDGGEVDEESPALADSGSRAWIRRGEAALLRPDASSGSVPPAIVLRLGGLYGPGRSPLEWVQREEFRRRLASAGAAAYMNWIHVEDAATAVVAAALKGRPGEIYLVVDSSPVRRRDFYEHAARLAGTSPPVFSNDGEDLGKKCRNRKLLEELGVELRHPDFRAGLEALA